MLFRSVILVTMTVVAYADEQDDIVLRCRKQMGEYGSAMTKACVDQDIEAMNALNTYPSEAKPFIVRCKKQMASYGWALTQACVDQDMDAEKSLEKY